MQKLNGSPQLTGTIVALFNESDSLVKKTCAVNIHHFTKSVNTKKY